MLAGKGSSGSDRLNVLGDQILHLHFSNAIMDSQEIPAYLKSFRKVCLVLIFGIMLFYFDICYYLGTEVMQYCTSPYFLDNVLIFFGVKCLET
jgi:hypothetical protein